MPRLAKILVAFVVIAAAAMATGYFYPPARLFATNIVPGPDVPKYGVTTDGQRFLGIEPVAGGTSFTFLFNWLNAKAAPGGDPVQ